MIFLSFDIGDNFINYAICRKMKRKNPGLKLLESSSRTRGNSILLQVQAIITGILAEYQIDGVAILYNDCELKAGEHNHCEPTLSTIEREILEKFVPEKFGFPCHVMNRRHAFAWWEFTQITDKEVKDILYLEIEESINCTIIANGQVLHGHKGLAGAIGNLSVRGEGFCQQATSIGLLKFFEMIYKYQITEEEFFERLPHSDKFQSILDVYIDHLTEGLCLLVKLLNPALIVLGGRLMSHYNMSSKVETVLTSKLSPIYWCDVKRAQMSENLVHLGAVLYLENKEAL